MDLMANTSDILTRYRTIAVVGLSPNRARPSHGVSEYMKRSGYRIIPVNPGHAEILGEKCYRTLDDVTEPVEIVNVFRRSEYVPDIAEMAIRKGAKVLWLQEGIAHEQAAEKARAAGLEVVMNTCILKEHMRMRRA
jgi:predicted CoA-binding protein